MVYFWLSVYNARWLKDNDIILSLSKNTLLKNAETTLLPLFGIKLDKLYRHFCLLKFLSSSDKMSEKKLWQKCQDPFSKKFNW